MDKLPVDDVPMLASAINFLLRDHICADLDEVCARYGVERTVIEEKLASKGLEYNAELNKVW